MNIELFGKLENGQDARLYTLKSGECEVKLSDYGAMIVSFVFDGKGVIGGFDKLSTYLTDNSHQGATIGRVANRIAGACFTMDGKEYSLPKNDGDNCLHGGLGFDFRLFDVKEYDGEHIVFSYLSPDGDEGFPAELKVEVCYTLLGSELIIDYKAIPGGKTPIALTNHSYFNLDGFGADVLSHKLTIYADRYTEVGEDLIPNGNRPLVEGTPFDFRSAHEIGERIAQTAGGYDHNFILTPTIHKEYLGKSLALAAVVDGRDIRLKVYTDQSGIQVYTGNFLGYGADFSGGIKQVKHGALCLEAQTEPNAVKHGECFYNEGEIYTHTTVYSFEKM